MTIKKLTADDLPALTDGFGSEFERTHEDDLADQGMGLISFYVAHLDGRPVGHGLVHWSGPRNADVAAKYPDCSEIYRMSVLEPYQSMGHGTRLIRACESEARERGCPTLGLGVGTSNARAEALYTKLGFKASSIEKYIDRYRYRSRSGEVEWVNDPAAWLIKELE